MPEKLNFSGTTCLSGTLIVFSGLNLSLDETYRIQFSSSNSIPVNTNVRFNPTGYFLKASEIDPTVQTLFYSNSNISDNSSINTIYLSIYDNSNNLVFQDYKSIVCGNLCGGGLALTPSPSVTPTLTPTPTVTPTPPPAPLSIRAIFDKLINKNVSCNDILVRGKAYGDINKTYTYTFGTDMTGVDLKISNPSGNITLLESPTYIYTTISLPESCKDFSLEFGLSDENYTVQSAAIFRCGNC